MQQVTLTSPSHPDKLGPTQYNAAQAQAQPPPKAAPAAFPGTPMTRCICVYQRQGQTWRLRVIHPRCPAHGQRAALDDQWLGKTAQQPEATGRPTASYAPASSQHGSQATPVHAAASPCCTGGQWTHVGARSVPLT
jgi:hypothetical protein